MSAGSSSFRSFEDSRSHVWTLGIKSKEEWVTFCRSGIRPADIHTALWKVYSLQWDIWEDWFGTGSRSRRCGRSAIWRSYEDAKAFVHSLGIRTVRE